MNKPLLLLIALIAVTNVSYGQPKQVAKKDTLYYLLDTAKIPVKDRIIDIIPYPNSHSFYTYIIRSNCMIYQSDPNLMSIRNDPGEAITKKEVNKLTFISLVTLNSLLCKEMGNFKSNHQLVFIEHLPNGRYLKRKIILGSLEYGTKDHILTNPH